MTGPATPTIDDVKEAAARLKGVAAPTPLRECPLPDGGSGKLLLKLETEQVTGSFKFRGAFNRISQVPEDARAAGVVAFSSGNHAQAVAAVANRLSIPAVIVMPEDAPRTKIENTRGFGAEVVTYDRWSESREEIAAAIQSERGMTLIKPFDDPGIIAGQGTVGLEIAEALAADGITPDQILVPCSGGGLVSGTAIAIKDRFPACDIYSVEPEGFDDTARSLTSGERATNGTDARSICDALLVPTPGEITLSIMRQLLAGGLAVSDEATIRAMKHAYEQAGAILEPGGAVALTAILESRVETADKITVGVCSGGNIDRNYFEELTGIKL